MRYSEILEYEDTGTYIQFTLTDETNKNLHQYIIGAKVPNPLGINDFHVTVMSSLSQIEWEALYGVGIEIEPLNIEVWDTDSGPVLVLLVSSPFLTERYEKAVDAGAISMYADFKPHISLSYDCERFQAKHMELPRFPIELDKEVVKPNVI